MSEFHPVQVEHTWKHGKAKLPSEVTLRAYEVYSAIYGAQPALIDLKGHGCRGGFGTVELIAFLYARSFPKQEWSARFMEACQEAKEQSEGARE